MENSTFRVLSDLGNFRYQVQCRKCGHEFSHKSGGENSCNISDTETSPMCPVCGAVDTMPQVEQVDKMTTEEAFMAFHVTLMETEQKGVEPWTIFDLKSRQTYSRREGCIEQGKEWLEQDIKSNEFDGTLTEKQVMAIRTLWPEEKASDLLAFCRHS